MNIGDIVEILPENREFEFLTNRDIPLFGVVADYDGEDHEVLLCLLNYTTGHGGDHMNRNDCWWVGSRHLEVIEQVPEQPERGMGIPPTTPRDWVANPPPNPVYNWAGNPFVDGRA